MSLETKIDQFRLKEEEDARREHVEISNSEGALNRCFTVHSPKLIVARVDSSSEEEEKMALNLSKGLKELLAGMNKG